MWLWFLYLYSSLRADCNFPFLYYFWFVFEVKVVLASSMSWGVFLFLCLSYGLPYNKLISVSMCLKKMCFLQFGHVVFDKCPVDQAYWIIISKSSISLLIFLLNLLIPEKDVLTFLHWCRISLFLILLFILTYIVAVQLVSHIRFLQLHGL